ncbi:hypothetical protein M5D96_013888 [Drosophila gunungcola]|uniref:Uncharacterized protein n=1 Tax=Drosophila gunungcola TaxID=103775 RepID=A0A9Q0BHZ7_9MUSC|nr:hypothetical protein M5D96_013888 [Drosophila gunungcola]
MSYMSQYNRCFCSSLRRRKTSKPGKLRPVSLANREYSASRPNSRCSAASCSLSSSKCSTNCTFRM